MLVCLLGAFLFCRALVRSPFGAVLRGIRENEAKTLALGYNTRRYKIAVVAISFALGGLAGALYAPFAGFANTELLFWLLSGQVLIMVIVGGAGTLIGPILGAAFFMLRGARAQRLHRFLGAVLRADLHRLRDVRAGGHLGILTARLSQPDAGLTMALLELDGLTKRYGGLVAVDQVTMRVESRRGARRHRPERRRQDHPVQPDHRRGASHRGQRPLRRPDRSPACRRIAICQRGMSRTFQLTALFPEMTARENTRLAAQARLARRWQPCGGGAVFAEAARRGDAALERLGLTHVADRPAGLLSHGDQRLLEVAMAMAQQPAPAAAGRADAGPVGRGDRTGGRDAGRPAGDGQLTVLLVEHDMEVVFRLAHRITVLHRGRVIADGAPGGGEGRCRRCRTPISGAIA